MPGIERVKSRADKTPDANLAEAVLYRAPVRGLSFRTTVGHVLTLTVKPVEALEALRILEEAIAAGTARA